MSQALTSVIMQECGQCKKNASTLPLCKGCRGVRYCGLVCQAKHWPNHKAECKKRSGAQIMAFLPEELVYVIFSKLSLAELPLFRVSKRFNNIRERVLIMRWVFRTSERPAFLTNRRREIGLSILLSAGWLREKLRRPAVRKEDAHKLYILQFIANKRRTQTVYPCKNSYVRMLVHRFCEAHDLEHKTIQYGAKKCLIYCDDGPSCCEPTKSFRAVKAIQITKKKK